MLKLPAIATPCPDGASNTKVTDFFVKEGTRNPGRVAGGITLRLAMTRDRSELLDFANFGDPIVLAGFAELLGFLILLALDAAPFLMVPRTPLVGIVCLQLRTAGAIFELPELTFVTRSGQKLKLALDLWIADSQSRLPGSDCGSRRFRRLAVGTAMG